MSTSRFPRSCTQTTEPERRCEMELLAAATRFAHLSASAPTTADGWPGHIEAAAEALVQLARADLDHAARVYVSEHATTGRSASSSRFWGAVDEMIAAHACDYGADGAGELLEELAAALARAMAECQGIQDAGATEATRHWLRRHGRP